jgi:methylated-DNA-protein-cysteine methyltransferase-like protein
LGEVSKAFAFGGENRQITLLENEGVELDGNRVKLEKYRWNRVTFEMLEKELS